MDLLIQQLAQELSLHPAHVEAVVTLLDEGNTIPFIARYRKEAHGSMSDDVLRELERHIYRYTELNTDKRFKSLEILEMMR